MSNGSEHFDAGGRRPETARPAINAPRVVVVLIAVFAAVHFVRMSLSPALGEKMLLTLAFIPLRYLPDFAEADAIPGGPGADLWSFVSHAFLHGDWVHLAVNSLWMLAFGSVLARRLGAARFLLFSALAAAAGAAAHLWLYWGQVSLLIGASGAISGQMAGAVRLIFAMPGGLRRMGAGDLSAVRPLSLTETFSNRQALTFLGVWLAIALITGALNITPSGGGQTIAWEAHVGGFLAGLFLFGLLDRRHVR